MKQKMIFLNMLVYSLSHAAVDATCIAVVFALVKVGVSEILPIILIYDVIAFSIQPILGLVADKLKLPAPLAAIGMMLVALSTVLMGVPLAAVIITGIGNALFHVAGGQVSLELDYGKAALPGIFVAPGALGVTIGVMVGKSGFFISWPFEIILLILAAAVFFLPKHSSPTPIIQPGRGHWFEAVILLLLVSVAIRSLVGQSLVLPWKSDPTLLILFTLCVVLGKALGGMLADRFGWSRVGVGGLLIAAPLLAFGTSSPILIFAGIFLFNLSMPVTLACVGKMLPGKSGFAFGLTALALIIGALPVFTPYYTLTGQPGFIFVTILISIVALFYGLRLYNSHFDPLQQDRQTQITGISIKES